MQKKPEKNSCRIIKRLVAKKKMENEGIKKINKRMQVYNPLAKAYEKADSYFKLNWRETY